MKKPILTGLLSLAAATAHAQTQEQVGDLDSFGRTVIYLGVANAKTIFFAEDCTQQTAAGQTCVVVPAQPQTNQFRFDNLASVQLPARVSNSLLCFSLTPNIARTLENKTSAATIGHVTFVGTISIESTVLNNPALINPATGLPLGGKIEINAVARNEYMTMQPGEFLRDSSVLSRSCQNSLVSKRSLVEQYGLTAVQATAFFNGPITVRLSSFGNTTLMTMGSFAWGLRLYGDKR